MKKRFLIFICMLLSASVFAATFKKGDKVYVCVKTSVLKTTSGSGAKNVTDVFYGDELIVVSVSGKKIQVKQSAGAKKTGWIAGNNLTKKKIMKTASGGKVSASTTELALAGKGFTEESEKVIQTADSELDYSKVDLIEKISVSESVLNDFITAGHLQGAK